MVTGINKMLQRVELHSASFLEDSESFLSVLYFPLWQIGEWSPKDVQILIAGTCQCVTLFDKRDFLDIIIIQRIWRLGAYAGLSRWAQCHHKGPYKKIGGQRPERRCVDASRGWGDVL